MPHKKTLRGEMALYYVIFSLVICCLLFPLFQFLTLYEEGITLRNKLQADLNSFWTEAEINARDNIKKGVLATGKVDVSSCEKQVCTGLGFTQSGDIWADSHRNYSISNMLFQTKLSGESVIVFCQYNLNIPVKMLGMTIATPVIPQTAESYLAKRYYSADEYQDQYLTGEYKSNQIQTEKTYNISVTASGGGNVKADKPQCSAHEVCTVSATPNAGKTFVCWESETGVVISTKPEYAFIPTANTALVAVFEGT